MAQLPAAVLGNEPALTSLFSERNISGPERTVEIKPMDTIKIHFTVICIHVSQFTIYMYLPHCCCLGSGDGVFSESRH